MDDVVGLYRSKLAEIEPCTDAWFGETLQAAQAGDDNARRRIVGSCLIVALKVVEQHFEKLPDDELLGRVEDANYRLWCSVPTFQGKRAEDFVHHVEQAIEAHLAHTYS